MMRGKSLSAPTGAPRNALLGRALLAFDRKKLLAVRDYNQLDLPKVCPHGILKKEERRTLLTVDVAKRDLCRRMSRPSLLEVVTSIQVVSCCD
jgi:hypothetical protein